MPAAIIPDKLRNEVLAWSEWSPKQPQFEVKKIPDTFDDSTQYFSSFRLPLLEELRQEILGQIYTPADGLISDIEPLDTPGLYKVIMTESSFQPVWGDIILLVSQGLTVIACVEKTVNERVFQLKASPNMMTELFKTEIASARIHATFNIVTYERVWEGLRAGPNRPSEELRVIHHMLRKNEDAGY